MKTALMLALLLTVVTPSLSLAQQPPAAQNEFVPVSELPPDEQLPAAPLLIGAYAFVWVTLMVYLWSLWRKVGRVEQELAQVASRVTGGGAGGPAGKR